MIVAYAGYSKVNSQKEVSNCLYTFSGYMTRGKERGLGVGSVSFLHCINTAIPANRTHTNNSCFRLISFCEILSKQDHRHHNRNKSNKTMDLDENGLWPIVRYLSPILYKTTGPYICWTLWHREMIPTLF